MESNMGPFISIKKNKEFGKVYKMGKSIVDKYLVLYFLPNQQRFTRFGFSTGKKIGKAVIRNRIKRIMREICRTNSNLIKTGYDCVIIIRPRITQDPTYRNMEKSFLKLVTRADLLRKEMKQNENRYNRGD